MIKREGCRNVTHVHRAPVEQPAAGRPTMETPGPLIQAAIGVLALVMPVITWLDPALPGRPILAVLYLLLVPGVPLAALIRLGAAWVAGLPM